MASLFETYLAKISKAKSIVYDAIQSLHAHRNLCEDFMNVTTIEDEEIAFCFDVDVQPSADIEKVQAEMFYAIENFLNPSLQFYTLKELLDKKIPVDDIFTSPYHSMDLLIRNSWKKRICVQTFMRPTSSIC